MKKIFLIVFASFSFTLLLAQNDSLTEIKKPSTKYDLSNRPGDHFMIQFSSDHLTGMPDSISSHQSGFSKGLNIYLMTDKPFKGDARFSVGIGIGIGSSNIAFKKLDINVKSTSPLLPFTALDSTDHFKRYKLSMNYLEVPLELRFASNPADNGKSWKIALGGKIGTLINLHTKGKDLQDKNNRTINSYTEKVNSKKYFNSTRLMATARIGYGIISVFGVYQVTNLLKAAAGANIKVYQIGIALSGL